MRKESALKSNVSRIFLNTFGLQAALVKVYKLPKDQVDTTPETEEADEATTTTSTPSAPSDAYTKADLKKLDAAGVKALALELGLDNSGVRALVEKRILER